MFVRFLYYWKIETLVNIHLHFSNVYCLALSWISDLLDHKVLPEFFLLLMWNSSNRQAFRWWDLKHLERKNVLWNGGLKYSGLKQLSWDAECVLQIISVTVDGFETSQSYFSSDGILSSVFLLPLSGKTGMQRVIKKEKGENKWQNNFILIIALEYKYILLVHRLKQASFPLLVDEILLDTL